MKLRIIAFLYAAISAPLLQAVCPIPPYSFNEQLFNKIHSFSALPNNPRFTQFRTRSADFIKKNYGYVGTVVILTFAFHWWYKKLTRQTTPAPTTMAQPQSGSAHQGQPQAVSLSRLMQITRNTQWRSLCRDKTQQLNLLSMLFDFESNLQDDNITQSLDPRTFIQQACEQATRQEPHVISFNNRPFFSTSAYIEAPNHLHLKIQLCARRRNSPMHIIIKPSNAYESAKKVSKMFAATADTIFRTRIAPVYPESSAPIIVELPVLNNSTFNQLARSAMSEFDAELESILKLEHQSSETN